MSSTVYINGNTFEEKGGKLYLNGDEITTDNKVTIGYPWRHVFLSFLIGFAVAGVLAKVIPA